MRGPKGECHYLSFERRKTSLYCHRTRTYVDIPHPVDTRDVWLPWTFPLPLFPPFRWVSTTRIARRRSWFRGSLHERHVVRDLSRERETGGRARDVTGLGGFVKAMHCKELTTTIPSLSLSLFLLLSCSHILSLVDRASRLSVSLCDSFLLPQRVSLFLSLSRFPPAFSLSLSIYLYLPHSTTSRPFPLAWSLLLPLFLSVLIRLSLPSISLPLSLPSYLFLSLPPFRSRRARWGALATCASLVNNSSRFSIRGISHSDVWSKPSSSSI